MEDAFFEVSPEADRELDKLAKERFSESEEELVETEAPEPEPVQEAEPEQEELAEAEGSESEPVQEVEPDEEVSEQTGLKPSQPTETNRKFTQMLREKPAACRKYLGRRTRY